MISPIESSINHHRNQLAYDDGKIQIQYGSLQAALAESAIMQLANIDVGDYIAWSPENDFDSFLNFWTLQQRGCVTCPISSRISNSKRCEMAEQINAKSLKSMLNSKDKVQRTFVNSKTDGDPQQPATLIFSSGSTGQPKAIVHAMSAHIASATGAAEIIPLESGDRWLWSLPLYHISGLSILIRCATAGATVVGLPVDQELNAHALEKLKVTHLSVVTTQLRRLLAEKTFPSQYLRTVLLGGSSIDPKLVETARNRGVDVRTTYGLSEMASQVTTSAADGTPKASGKLLENRQLQISSTGEILVRGETLALGYLQKGEIQSLVNQDGWFQTNDIGALNGNSELVVSGRIDNMFISGGENIHPENIERAMTTLFNVEQVIVVPSPDKEFGARPVAFVDGTLPMDWKEKIMQLLPNYEVPFEIHPWPSGTDTQIKPDRIHLQRLISG
ncbi:MAG: o-succinylbenzoate--CoA ligase [Mariniblastus sp.]|nr:o-succinylbenzoate--CoA ligase [Mariniblastus sp.]